MRLNNFEKYVNVNGKIKIKEPRIRLKFKRKLLKTISLKTSTLPLIHYC